MDSELYKKGMSTRRSVLGDDHVDKAIKAGWSEEAAVRDVQVPEFAHVSRYKEWMPIDVKAAYRQMRGK